MYQILNQNKELGNVLEFKISSTLTKQDYQEFVPLIEQQIDKFGPINLLIQFEDFHDISIRAIWEDLKFDAKHYDDFKRVALVGQKDWLKWLTKLSRLFYQADVKYFEPEELPEAQRWIYQQEVVPETA